MNSENQLSRNQGTVYVITSILISGFIVGLGLYLFNDAFRNPQGHLKTIEEWKSSLKSHTDKKYLNQFRTSLVLSLEDSTYLSIGDSELVSLLMTAKIISVSGYVPRVEQTKEQQKNRMHDRYIRDDYFAVELKGHYVLIANKECIPVWGTRPLEIKVAPSPHIKAVRVPQTYSLRFFYFLSTSPSG